MKNLSVYFHDRSYDLLMKNLHNHVEVLGPALTAMCIQEANEIPPERRGDGITMRINRTKTGPLSSRLTIEMSALQNIATAEELTNATRHAKEEKKD